MDRIKFDDLRLEPLLGSRIVVWQRWLWMVLFFTAFLLVIGRGYLPALVIGNAAWPEGCLLFLATGWILTSLARQLPLQNVLLTGCLLGGIPSLAMILNHYASIPFGPVVFSGRVPMVPGGIPLFGPLIWIVAILSSRGVARLALRPWRQGANYGFWLFGVTVALTLVFDLGLEFCCPRARLLDLVAHAHSVFLVWHAADKLSRLGDGDDSLAGLRHPRTDQQEAGEIPAGLRSPGDMGDGDVCVCAGGREGGLSTIDKIDSLLFLSINTPGPFLVRMLLSKAAAPAKRD